MSIRKILVPIAGNGDDEAVLVTGLDLAGRLRAHLEVLHVALDSRDALAMVGEGMTPAMIEQIMTATEREGREQAGRARSLFERLVRDRQIPLTERPGAEGASAGFVERLGREEDLVAERGRLSDLIIAQQPRPEGDGGGSLALEAALRDSGRPVLVMPRGGAESFGRVAVIAWNGSVEATRAISGAMPFLQRAERVVAFSILEETMYGPPVADLEAYLALHGVRATAAPLAPREDSLGRTLLAAARAEGADFMVQGAYTRSRMRRLIFGGVTADVLAGTTIPVLMAH